MSRRSLARAAAAALLVALAAGGCSRAVKAPPAAPAADAEEVLAALRARTASVRSFHSTGTVYLRTNREKHFLHFEAWFERPSRSRLVIDLPGFLGLGSGRLTVVRSGDRIAFLRPGSEEVEHASLADTSLAPLSVFGLAPADAVYLVAPHAGPEDLYRTENVVAFAAARNEGFLRLVLRREDGLREVLRIASPSFALAERRVVEPEGTVHFASSYRYEAEEEAFAREVETYLPREEMRLTARFQAAEQNVAVADSVFRLAED
ncbi:MAG: hypothetical protein ABIH26_03240 [Candidatus Eisenbacteria bacterium]